VLTIYNSGNAIYDSIKMMSEAFVWNPFVKNISFENPVDKNQIEYKSIQIFDMQNLVVDQK